MFIINFRNFNAWIRADVNLLLMTNGNKFRTFVISQGSPVHGREVTSLPS